MMYFRIREPRLGTRQGEMSSHLSKQRDPLQLFVYILTLNMDFILTNLTNRLFTMYFKLDAMQQYESYVQRNLCYIKTRWCSAT